ncbi:Ankyrin repeat domain-containing protein [Plasmodiophora brassicae]|uniref:Uncharacterized protein n=1 Tax=Plasmodiophora brassicae TaxID=37360 RepID=A0A0G4IWI3_PLABS|nr:hypothetical protein PBRA_007406 [Plasmodiophora brassicae]SPQ97997.1 unnamed protein product [Plasmodiophora brassicae]
MSIGNRSRLAAVSPISMLAIALLHTATVDATRIICTADGGATHDYDTAQFAQHSSTVQRMMVQAGGPDCVELPVTSQELQLAIGFADNFPLPEAAHQIPRCRDGAGHFIKRRFGTLRSTLLEQFILAAALLEMRSLMVAIGWAIESHSTQHLEVVLANRDLQACRFIRGIFRLRHSAATNRRRLNVARRISLLFAFPHGADADLPSLTDTAWNANDGENALQFAAATGEADIVEVLLQIPGLDVNGQLYGSVFALVEPPLLLAVRGGHTAIVRMLLQFRGNEANRMNQRVNANVTSRLKRETPLSIAAANGHVEIVQALLQVAAIDVHARTCYPDGSKWWTPLHWAASDGHDSVVWVLLNDGRSEINALDEHGHTPLTLAMQYGRIAVALLLQSNGGQ